MSYPLCSESELPYLAQPLARRRFYFWSSGPPCVTPGNRGNRSLHQAKHPGVAQVQVQDQVVGVSVAGSVQATQTVQDPETGSGPAATVCHHLSLIHI